MKTKSQENAAIQYFLFTMSLRAAIKLLLQLKARRLLVVRARRHLAPVNALIEASERFEEELALVVEHGEDDESPPEDLLAALRAFQNAWNSALAVGWRP